MILDNYTIQKNNAVAHWLANCLSPSVFSAPGWLSLTVRSNNSSPTGEKLIPFSLDHTLAQE
jgi:hypothetical protein